MASENIGALVITDVVDTEGSTVVGMFSERDVLRALVAKGPEIMRLPVERLMSRTLISCGPNDHLADVMEKMERHGIRHVPVLEGHALVGVISVRDVLQMLRGLVSRQISVPAA
jgi:CBS domain-containing protein